MGTLSRLSGACNTPRPVSLIFHPLARTHGGPLSHGFDLDAERRIAWTYSAEPCDPAPSDEILYQLDDLKLRHPQALVRESKKLKRHVSCTECPAPWKVIRLQRIERELRDRGGR